MHPARTRLKREVEPPTASPRSRRRRLAALIGASAILLGATFLVRSSHGNDGAAQVEPPLVAARYWVEPGDTVWDIARRLEVPGGPETIMAMNQLGEPGLIRPGQVLWVLAPAPRVAELPRPFDDAIEPAPTCRVDELAGDGEAPELGSGCQEIACVADDRGARLCHCWPEDYIVLEEPGRPAVLVDVPSANRANVRAGTIDLDEDGADEIIAVIQQGTSNGIAHRLYHAIIFDGADRDTRVEFSTRGWGVAAGRAPAGALSPPLDALFLRADPANDDAACSVAPASFERLVDPLLGSGNYVAQRLYRYQPGELVAPEVPDLRVERLHPGARLQRWPTDPRE